MMRASARSSNMQRTSFPGSRPSLLAFTFALCPGVAFAVDPDGILLGSGITVFPNSGVSVTHDDNAYLQPDESAESVLSSRYKAGVTVEGDLRTTLVSAGYTIEKGIFNGTYDDNYLDHTLSATADTDLDSRNQLSAQASFKSGHDGRGQGTLEGADALGQKYIDEFNEVTAGAEYTLGADQAFANVSARLSGYQKHYKNNFEAGTRDRDHRKLTAGAGAAFALSSVSGVLVDFSLTDIQYSNQSVEADNREGNIVRLLGGFGWDITGKTTGTAKAGIVRRGFDNKDIDSDTRFSWEAGIIWEPKDYSTVSFMTAQAANETSGPGNYIDSSLTRLSWSHRFSAFYSLVADASLNIDEYYQSEDGRKDRTLSTGLKGVYAPSDQVDFSLHFKHANRDSSASGLDYSQNVVTLGVVLAI